MWLVAAWLLFAAERSVGEEFTLSYLTNVKGEQNAQRQGLVVSGAISYAVERANNASVLGPRHRLRLVYNDTRADPVAGVRAVLHHAARHGAVAFIGPEDSCNVEATVATALNLPMISYKCSEVVSSSSEYPLNFLKTYPQDTRVVYSLEALLNNFNWRRLALVQEGTRWFETLAREVELRLQERVAFRRVYRSQSALSQLADIVKDTHEEAYVYVFLGPVADLLEMMLHMHLRGLLSDGKYVFIAIHRETYSEKHSYFYLLSRRWSAERLAMVKDVARNLLIIAPSQPRGQLYSDFARNVRIYNTKAPFNFAQPFENRKLHITMFAAYLYDATMLYIEALREALLHHTDPRDGHAIIQSIVRRKKYQSIAGVEMHIDHKGEVEGNYSVLALCPTPPDLVLEGVEERPSHTMLTVGEFLYDDKTRLPVYSHVKAIDWVSGEPPLDEPPCGFHNEKCRTPFDYIKAIATGILFAILVAFSFLALLVYRNWKYEQEIAGLLWKIHPSELLIGKCLMHSCDSKTSLGSHVSMESKQGYQIFTSTMVYKGSIVATKTLVCQVTEFSRAVKKEMKLLSSLNHKNVNPFIGACLQDGSVTLVTEYCSKGSLQDILENHDLRVDEMFTASLVYDLIKGMLYLHGSELKVHGNLKSSNCVVTSRWVLRLTDFGLSGLRAASKRSRQLTEHEEYRDMLWKAPELLRATCPAAATSQKGDVYAFSIILHEIVARQGVFAYEDLHFSPREMVERVRKGEGPRPDIRGLPCADYIKMVMTDCWAERPVCRPEFRHIFHRLQRMREGLKHNLVDHMVDMLERYADNLEELVEARTAELHEEQRKTEALLHRMLPQSVAAQLVRGEPVEPESFDAVTIYFSDIVGFTAMSADSTPMEVVTFLNDLYTVFDDIISNYDVYKVETIGDAYMVVSGLPLRNGDRHVAEVASMALHLLGAVRRFHIRHRPGDTLRLRIGIHTGPVVAGVVGNKMPRYCLFGDTVNTASRMESNGEALKIHISPECKQALQKIGGYDIAERGLVEMKGKGRILTYWLEGMVQDSDAEKRSPHLPRRGSIAFRKEPLQDPLLAFLKSDSPRMSRRHRDSVRRRGGELRKTGSFCRHENRNSTTGEAASLTPLPETSVNGGQAEELTHPLLQEPHNHRVEDFKKWHSLDEVNRPPLRNSGLRGMLAGLLTTESKKMAAGQAPPTSSEGLFIPLKECDNDCDSIV